MRSLFHAPGLAHLSTYRLTPGDLRGLCNGLEWLIREHQLKAHLFSSFTEQHCFLRHPDEVGEGGQETSPLARLRECTEWHQSDNEELDLPPDEWFMVFCAAQFSLLVTAARDLERGELQVKLTFDPDQIRELLNTELAVHPRRDWIRDELSSEPTESGLTARYLLKVLESQNQQLEAIQASESRMFRLAEQSLDLIYRIQLNPKFKILYISPIVETWMGCSREELYQDARNAWGHIHPDDVRMLQRMMTEENATQGLSLVRFLPAQGDPYWIEHRWFVDRSTDRSVIVLDGVGRDISLQKRQEQAVQEALRTAEENLKAKSLFLANMSHEIRTPLNAIIGQVELLEDTLLAPEQREMLESIHAAGAILLSHLSDVLDYSRLDAQRVTLVNEPFDPVDAVSEALLMVKEAGYEKGLEFAREFDFEVPSLVVGDRTKVVQVCLNLLSNAVKFTDRGTIGVKLQNLPSDNGLARLRITITDTGIGFPNAELPHLLQPFSQHDPTSTRTREGAGLGLAIVKRLIELLGGELQAHSEVGRGSTFTVTFAFSPSPEAIPWIESVRRQWSPLLEGHELAFGYSAGVKKRGTVEVRLLQELDLLHPQHPKARWLVTSEDSVPGRPIISLNPPLSPSVFLSTILPSDGNTLGGFMERPLLGLQVLVVEDNDVNQRVITRQLAKLGLAKPDFAQNGQEALERFLPGQHQVVLMDIQMPMLDGVQTMQALRERYPHLKTPIIAVTAHALPDDRDHYLQLGFDGYLSKPVRVNSLRAVLREAWAQSG